MPTITREHLRQKAKEFGRLAESFVGSAPREGQARRAERDAAVHALREAEKLLIQIIEDQPAALATPDTLPPVAVGDIGWLIERPHREGSAVCTYWSGFSDGAWTRKPELAVRFARQEDAERVRAGILGSPDRSRSAEHMWQRGKE